MTEENLKLLISKVKNFKTEFQDIEVKHAEKGGPDRLYDTLSSFSNQDDGGVILFGLDENRGFLTTGVYDINDLQRKVMEQCQAMEPPVRALFTVGEDSGKPVLAAEIPPIDITERPCFYKGKGRMRGSYVRVGDADIPMTEYEVYSFEAYRKKYQDDVRSVERASLTAIDGKKLAEYLYRLKENKPNLAGLEDERIYELMNITRDNKPTLSTVLLFGLYPQAYFPQLCIIAVSVPGTEIGETDIDGARFTDNKRIEGTIVQMLEGALKFIKNNMRTKTIIDGVTGRRFDRDDYPIKAVREIILNALIHRDYSIHTQGMPIQLTVYADRLEVISPGGLYGRLTLNNLGKIQPDTRNPVLATALEVLRITENRYSGIPTIRREMAANNQPEPVFTNERGEFKVTLLRKADKTEFREDSGKDVLRFCATPRTRKEIADFLGLSSVTYAMKTYIQPLIDSGDIVLSNPKSPQSRNQLYSAKLNN
jgi:ATP-dependent DNA helicase RecG